MASSLGQRMSRTAGLFQGLVAVPVLLSMGQTILVQLWDYYWRISLYDFITAIINSLLSAGILFIVITQHNPSISKPINFILEAVKSGLATTVWIWLMCDSIWGPERSYNEGHPRSPRIIMSAISVVCLLFLFYPTLIFAYLDKKNETFDEDEEVGGQSGGPVASESTPLLRD